MAQDYICYIASKFGHVKILLNVIGRILADEKERVLYKNVVILGLVKFLELP